MDLGALRAVVAELQQTVGSLADYLANSADTTEPRAFSFAPSADVLVSEDERKQLRMLAEREYKQRSRRTSMLERDLFGEPAWDILLDLFVADVDRKRVSVSSACVAARVPSTTALRWVKLLEGQALIERTVDPSDGRRMWVQLTQTGRTRMEQLLKERLTAT